MVRHELFAGDHGLRAAARLLRQPHAGMRAPGHAVCVVATGADSADGGRAGLFAVLPLVMVLTRKVNWFGLTVLRSTTTAPHTP